VSGDRVGNVGNVSRFRLSRASPPTAVTIRLVFAIGSTPGFDDGLLGSFPDCSRRVLKWTSPAPLARVTQAERRALFAAHFPLVHDAVLALRLSRRALLRCRRTSGRGQRLTMRACST
jgi:hypothetical protein